MRIGGRPEQPRPEQQTTNATGRSHGRQVVGPPSVGAHMFTEYTYPGTTDRYTSWASQSVNVNTRTPESATRQERRQLNHQALLDAALELLEEQSFSSLSLRQVTREAGIGPTAFYRHFDDMEETRVVLVD